MNTWVLVIAGALVLGCALVSWIWTRNLAFALTEQRLQLEAEHEKSFMEGTRVMAEQYAAVQIEVERAREVAQAERDKTSRYFVQISNFERQRNEWQQLYYAQSIGHGNAQALMMQTIENLARALQSKGVHVKLPAVLQAVCEEFTGTHERPAREGMELLKQAALPQPSVETHPVAPEAEPTVAQSS